MGILDYIAEVSLDTMRPEYFSNSFQQRPNDNIALAHEDDLKMVKGVVRTNAIPSSDVALDPTTGRTDCGRSRELFASKRHSCAD